MSLLPLRAQVLKFHAVGAGGTTPAQASNGQITHFGVVGGIVAQGSSAGNHTGFFYANLDYRPATQSSDLTFSSSSADNTTFSVTVNWTKGNGARRLMLVREGTPVNASPMDGTSYTANATFGSGSEIGSGNFVVYDGTGNSVTVSGLTNKVYYFKVFEYNGRYGDNDVNIVYQPGDATGNPRAFAAEPTARPTAITFSEIVATSMKGTFPAANATGYLVLRKTGSAPTEVPQDGVTYSGTFGQSTVVHNGSENVFVSTGLTAATTYYYALFAYNGSGSTINYLSTNPLQVSKITVPVEPTVTLSNATATNFNAEWTEMPTATGYGLDVSTEEDFSSFVDGYEDKYIAGTLTNVTGLLPSTQYFVRVRALNSSGPSANSATRFITTQASPTGPVVPLSVTTSQTSQSANHTTVSASVSGGFGIRTVKVHVRNIRSTDAYTVHTLEEVGGGKYEYTVAHASVADPLGLELKFEVTDATGTQTTTGYFYSPIPPNTEIPNMPFGGKTSDYRMISIPYSVTLNNSALVFASLGAYDKEKWRLLTWNGSNYVDNPSTILPGQAYWFNALTKPTIILGEGSVVAANKSAPFPIALRQGWNMIATPYPFEVSWDDVLEFNDNPAVSDYYVYTSEGYSTSSVLEPWKGGFVFADNALTLNIPVGSQSVSNGRTRRTTAFGRTPGVDENWIVPISVRQGNYKSSLHAFGMHEEASLSKDRFDAVALPSLFDAPELVTNHEEFFAPHFVRDVVPPHSKYVWSFTLKANATAPVELYWDNEALAQSQAQLRLYDPAAGKFVDMRLTDRYTVPSARDRKIAFVYNASGDDETPEELMTAYPNPFSTITHLPAIANTSGQPSPVKLQIRNAAGLEVFSEHYELTPWGVVQPAWDGRDNRGNDISAGVYFYYLTYSGEGQLKTLRGKLVKR